MIPTRSQFQVLTTPSRSASTPTAAAAPSPRASATTRDFRRRPWGGTPRACTSSGSSVTASVSPALRVLRSSRPSASPPQRSPPPSPRRWPGPAGSWSACPGRLPGGRTHGRLGRPPSRTRMHDLNWRQLAPRAAARPFLAGPPPPRPSPSRGC
jgi:hypothetical protein